MKIFASRAPSRLPLLFLLILGFLLSPASLDAAPSAPGVKIVSSAALPSALGKVVYQKNTGSSIHIFIILNSHRSCSTGANGSLTVTAQVETFRIGEWLIRQKQVGLLLPEGFFGREESSPRVGMPAHRLDTGALEEKLTDTSTFVNADLLLQRVYGIGLHQVEDRDLYRKARECLCAGLKGDAALALSDDRELRYLQTRRLAAILQNIPSAIEVEYRQGDITRPRAMLTLGMAHLGDLLRFLKEGEIRIPPPRGDGEGFPAFREDLGLLKKKVGVTVIVPRALAANPGLMRLARLEPSPAAVP